VFGGPSGEDPARLLARGLAFEGAHVHLYGKSPKPGRKLGHVTVCGAAAEQVRARAWAAALALGTPVPAGMEMPEGIDAVGTVLEAGP
jgi:5-(carboxyamino)imidazole ribonucleotide synthase